MPRKSKETPSPYANVASANLDATSVEVAESGTVRMALLLDALNEALKEIPGAAHTVSIALLAKLGANPDTRIMP